MKSSLLFNSTSYQFIRSVARSLATLHLQISFTCKTAFPAIIKTQSEPSLSGGSFEECCRWGSGRRWSSAGKPVKNWHTRGPRWFRHKEVEVRRRATSGGAQ